MDEWDLDVYQVWSNMEVIFRKKKQMELDFNRQLMVYDAFKAYDASWRDESGFIIQ